MKSGYYNFPQSKMMYSNILFYSPNRRKPKDIHITIINDKEFCTFEKQLKNNWNNESKKKIICRVKKTNWNITPIGFSLQTQCLPAQPGHVGHSVYFIISITVPCDIIVVFCVFVL